MQAHVLLGKRKLSLLLISFRGTHACGQWIGFRASVSFVVALVNVFIIISSNFFK